MMEPFQITPKDIGRKAVLQDQSIVEIRENTVPSLREEYPYAFDHPILDELLFCDSRGVNFLTRYAAVFNVRAWWIEPNPKPILEMDLTEILESIKWMGENNSQLPFDVIRKACYDYAQRIEQLYTKPT